VKVLVVAAHPDDVELLCAGTLARLAAAEHDLALAHMTVGDKGGQQPPEELARTRGEEARRAAAILGAEAHGGICGDLELYACELHAARIDELLAETGPDVLLTHALNDYHPDHHITARLVLDHVAALSDPPGVLFMDTVAGIDFVPDVYCDVTGTVDVKKRMLRCHESQIQWMATARHTDMEYMIEWLGRWRGLQCGARYAEGFRVEREIGRPERADALLEAVRIAPAGVAQ
jgi:LmbE family N-acetylglucosaminyl deacetylase